MSSQTGKERRRKWICASRASNEPFSPSSPPQCFPPASAKCFCLFCFVLFRGCFWPHYKLFGTKTLSRSTPAAKYHLSAWQTGSSAAPSCCQYCCQYSWARSAAISQRSIPLCWYKPFGVRCLTLALCSGCLHFKTCCFLQELDAVILSSPCVSPSLTIKCWCFCSAAGGPCPGGGMLLGQPPAQQHPELSGRKARLLVALRTSCPNAWYKNMVQNREDPDPHPEIAWRWAMHWLGWTLPYTALALQCCDTASVSVTRGTWSTWLGSVPYKELLWPKFSSGPVASDNLKRLFDPSDEEDGWEFSLLLLAVQFSQLTQHIFNYIYTWCK